VATDYSLFPSWRGRQQRNQNPSAANIEGGANEGEIIEHMAQSEINHLLNPREESAANGFKIPSFPEPNPTSAEKPKSGRGREREKENAVALEETKTPWRRSSSRYGVISTSTA
jgi:hypothetical protein